MSVSRVLCHGIFLSTKIVAWEPTINRFRYDPTYADKQPDWTFGS
jgi:hypothetical protein